LSDKYEIEDINLSNRYEELLAQGYILDADGD